MAEEEVRIARQTRSTLAGELVRLRETLRFTMRRAAQRPLDMKVPDSLAKPSPRHSALSRLADGLFGFVDVFFLSNNIFSWETSSKEIESGQPTANKGSLLEFQRILDFDPVARAKTHRRRWAMRSLYLATLLFPIPLEVEHQSGLAALYVLFYGLKQKASVVLCVFWLLVWLGLRAGVPAFSMPLAIDCTVAGMALGLLVTTFDHRLIRIRDARAVATVVFTLVVIVAVLFGKGLSSTAVLASVYMFSLACSALIPFRFLITWAFLLFIYLLLNDIRSDIAKEVIGTLTSIFPSLGHPQIRAATHQWMLILILITPLFPGVARAFARVPQALVNLMASIWVVIERWLAWLASTIAGWPGRRAKANLPLAVYLEEDARQQARYRSAVGQAESFRRRRSGR